MEGNEKIPAATILAVVVAFFSGGLAGAVFTWYVNRPDLTILTYNISTTPFGSAEAASVVPNLRVLIGTDKVSSLYTHTVDLIVPKGPFVDQIQFSLTFVSGTKVFGTRTESPTSIQTIDCSTILNGLKCQIGPVSAKMAKPFRVILATDRAEPPSLDVVAKNIELLSNSEYLNQGKMPWWLFVPSAILAGLCGGIIGVYAQRYRARARR